MTSYTPYQPEVAQGVLQAVFEFQTLVARLAGLPVANASLYDGAAAAVEAVNLGVAATGREDGVGVRRRQPALAGGPGHVRAPGPGTGSGRRPARRRDRRDWADDAVRRPTSSPGVVVVAYPNYLGCLEDLAAARALCDRTGALLVVAFDPVAAGVLRSPGRLGRRRGGGGGAGARHALGFGGPYLGLFACSLGPRAPAARAGWWARPSTPRAGAPMSRRCAPASRTSAGRRRPPTSAPTRP